MAARSMHDHIQQHLGSAGVSVGGSDQLAMSTWVLSFINRDVCQDEFMSSYNRGSFASWATTVWTLE